MRQQSYRHADSIISSTWGHVLWLGDVQAAENVAWIKQNNIKTVLTAAAGFKFFYDPAVRHYRHELQDSKTENISAHFDVAAFQIEKSLRTASVLVHCGAGVSRSSSLVIAYLIKYRGMGFQAALSFCKAKRPQVCPNLGFQLQLKAYQKQQGGHPLLNRKIALQKQRQKSELPSLEKQFHFNITFDRNSSKLQDRKIERSVHRRESSYVLEKTVGEQDKKKRQNLTYLRRMAQFRFGMTNMQKWGMNVTGGKQKN